MCRFLLYLGRPITLSSLITEPENSLIHQSFESRELEEPLNGDGFGVAWYVPEIGPDAAQFRAITPAWNNVNLRHIARLTRSPCVLAHVRAASPGLAVTETNTHPFVWGRYAFMHNGEVAGFAKIKRGLLGRLGDVAYRLIEGTTDSEHVFALFVERLLHEEEDHAVPAERMVRALTAALADVREAVARAGIREPSYLNLAVSDGACAVACRYSDDPAGAAPSVHVHTGKAYTCDGGTCRMLDPGPEGHAVIVASEPLSGDPGWSAVPPNHLVVIGTDRAVDVRPCLPR